MFRLILLAMLLAVAAISPATAQSETDVIAARDQFIDGQHALALRILLPAADAGNAMAQNLVADAYASGLGGLPVDPAQALTYMRLSAEQNYPRAHANLGLMHYYGMPGLDPDKVVARTYFESALDMGETGMIALLASMWLSGEGGPASVTRGMALLQFGVQQNDPKSLHLLGLVYNDGIYVPANPELARNLIRRAADLGIVNAMLDYGQMLELGLGGNVDLLQAVDQYRGAVDQGNLEAAMRASAIILGDSQKFPDFVEALVLCFWARDRATGTQAVEYRRICEQTQTHFNFMGVNFANERLLEMTAAESD